MLRPLGSYYRFVMDPLVALQSPQKISGYVTDMPVNICSKQTNILKQGSIVMTHAF